MKPPKPPSEEVEREDAMTEMTWDEYCAMRDNEGMPVNRNPQGVDTFKVRVLTVATVAKIIK